MDWPGKREYNGAGGRETPAFRRNGETVKECKALIRVIAVLLALLCAVPAAAERLDDATLLSFYEDSALIGDSRVEAFRRYVAAVRQADETYFAKTTIVCSGSISLFAASRPFPSDDYPFYYRARPMTLYGVAERSGAKKVFILLGLNDPVAKKPEKALSWIRKIITTMNEMVPGTEIYFFSETPVTKKFVKNKNRRGYQKLLDEYNPQLKKTCEENGAHYIELAEVLKGKDNYLREAYCSDELCHLNDDGIRVWIRRMMDYAQEQYDLGLWEPKSPE